MRGRQLMLDWQEDEATILPLYRSEPVAEVRTRLHALWLVRQGHPPKPTASLVGVHLRTVRTWLSGDHEGGLDAIRHPRPGGRQGQQAFLTKAQEQQVRDQTAQRTLTTIGQAVAWVQQQFGVTAPYWGMRSRLQRLQISSKGPRPLAEQADPAAQVAWTKGGSRPH